MSSSASSLAAPAIKKPTNKPPTISSGKHVTSSGKSVMSPGNRSISLAPRPEKPKLPVQGRDESGSKSKPVVTGSSEKSIHRTEKPKQAVQGVAVKRDDSVSKLKFGVSSPEVKKKPDSSTNQKSTPVVSKPEAKAKAITSSSKTVTKSSSRKTTKKTIVRGKTEKKVYSLPGQKYDVPEEREPLRIFYESLSKQIPSSEMAEFWLMEHGMLPPEKAKKAYERKQRRNQQIRSGTPVKPAKLDKPESSKKSQMLNNGDIKAKKRVNYSDDDDDFIIKTKKSKV